MSSGCGHSHGHGGHSHDHGHDHSHDHDHGHGHSRGGPRVHFARPPPAASGTVAAAAAAISTSAAKSESSNGKKGKKGGKKSAKKTGGNTANGDDDIDTLMKDLGLSGAGSGGAAGPKAGASAAADAELAEIRRARPQLSEAFAALKDRGAAPAAAHQAAAASSIAMIERLQQRLALTCRPDRLHATVQETRVLLAMAAYDAVNLMNKFDRAAQTHPAVATLPLNATAMDKLGELCQVQDSLVAFITNAGRVLASLDRATQAREMFDVAEKRLLKLETRPVASFRGWVKTYAAAREASGLGPTSSEAALRQLLWYIDDFAPGNPAFMQQLDGLYGRRCFFSVACKDGEQAFQRFGRAFRQHPGTENVLLFSQNVLFGCDMSEELEAVLRAFVAACKETGVGFIQESFHTRVPTIQIDKFEFSKTGIVVVDE